METWHDQCSLLVLTAVMNMHGHTSCWKPLNYGIIWSDLLEWTSFRCLPKQITVIWFCSGPPVPSLGSPFPGCTLLFPVPWFRTNSGVFLLDRLEEIWRKLWATGSEKLNKKNELSYDFILLVELNISFVCLTASTRRWPQYCYNLCMYYLHVQINSLYTPYRVLLPPKALRNTVII